MDDLEQRIKLPSMDAERAAKEIGDFIVDRITKQGKSGGVLGLSGGVDSTIVAAIAKRTPTAGLEPGQTDFGDLGYSYDVVEIVTEGFAQGFRVDDLVSHSQVLDVVAKSDAEFREEFGASKFSSTRDLIGDIKKRYDGARKKAALISPPIAPVSLEYR